MEEGGEEEGQGTPLDTIFPCLLPLSFFSFFRRLISPGRLHIAIYKFQALVRTFVSQGLFCLDLGIGGKISLSHLDTCRVACP